MNIIIHTTLKGIMMFLLAFILCMCSTKNVYTVENTGVVAADSIKIHCVDTITINIGDRLVPIPSSFQIVESGGMANYVIMDENVLHVFDLSADSIIEHIDLKGCGKLNNYSGFAFLNLDTIFTYNYENKTCFLVNTKGEILNSQILSKELIEKVSPEALSCTPPLSAGGRIYLSGKPISHSIIDSGEPISLYWDYRNHKLTPGASYSDEYTKGYFGGIYFNTIYQCKSDDNLITYSFPVSNYVYRFDDNLEFVDSLYMGSRYTQSILSEKGNIMDFLSDKDARLRFFLEQDSYGQIFYNDKENLYYRIAEHPLVKSETEKLRKPFSIIVMDNDGKLMAETPILNYDRSLITPNAHVYKDGIIIQIESEDENVIKFAYFKIG